MPLGKGNRHSTTFSAVACNQSGGEAEGGRFRWFVRAISFCAKTSFHRWPASISSITTERQP
jgi:hypothetical protein